MNQDYDELENRLAWYSNKLASQVLSQLKKKKIIFVCVILHCL